MVINYQIESDISQLSQAIVRPPELKENIKFQKNEEEKICHVSHVTCHMSRVTYHVSGITCHISN